MMATVRAFVAGAALMAGGCRSMEPAGVRYEASRFAALPGWQDADTRVALTAFRKSCAAPQRPSQMPPIPGLDAASLSVHLTAACIAAETVAAEDAAASRAFFETRFTPYRVVGADGPEGLFTGYYEPLLAASRQRWHGYRVPIHGLPPGHRAGTVLPSRADIEAGAWRGWPVLFWAADPVDVFTLHIQGSGRLRLAEGGTARVGYAGNNGHGYVPIGRLMRDRDLLPAGGTHMPAIRAWLRANPSEGAALMRENPRYIFFREIPDAEGPRGQSGVVLTPMASLAVDPAFIPMGLPLWLDTHRPAQPEAPLRLLVIAQDTGAAVKGAVRGDLFWGSGDAALENAGHMASRGRYHLLVPNGK